MRMFSISDVTQYFVQCVDAEHGASSLSVQAPDADRINWVRTLPFLLLHVACIAVWWVGWSRFAICTAVGLYLVRMFAITGIYHRYFSHRTYRTSRWLQFVFALLGASSVQRGPLWWAAHHRSHHKFADTQPDPAFAGPTWFLAVAYGMVYDQSPFPNRLSSCT